MLQRVGRFNQIQRLVSSVSMQFAVSCKVPVAPFSANARLLVPFSSLVRRQLVLAASHASVQWFLLNTLAKNLGFFCFCRSVGHVQNTPLVHNGGDS